MKKQSKRKRVAMYLRVGSREQLAKDSLPLQRETAKTEVVSNV